MIVNPEPESRRHLRQGRLLRSYPTNIIHRFTKYCNWETIQRFYVKIVQTNTKNNFNNAFVIHNAALRCASCIFCMPESAENRCIKPHPERPAANHRKIITGSSNNNQQKFKFPLDFFIHLCYNINTEPEMPSPAKRRNEHETEHYGKKDPDRP